MANKVVKLAGNREFDLLRKHLTEEEFADFSELCNHHRTIGHLVLNDNAQILSSENVDENDCAAFENVFDICDALTEEIGQKMHVSTSFESRSMEVICRRYPLARTVVLQTKNTVQAGA